MIGCPAQLSGVGTFPAVNESEIAVPGFDHVSFPEILEISKAAKDWTGDSQTGEGPRVEVFQNSEDCCVREEFKIAESCISP